MSEMPRGIPVVDLNIHGSLSGVPSPDNDKEAAKAVCDALKQIGFVYLVNSGIAQEKIQQAFEISKKYFSMTESIKKKARFTTKTLDGYTAVGDEIFLDTGVTEYKEAYDIVLNRHVYPTEPAEFKPIISGLIDDMVLLGTYVLQLIAEGMGFPRNTFADMHRKMSKAGNITQYRTLHYPPVENVTTEITRCGAHTDYGTMTMLVQDDAGGLQVRNRNDEWIDAVPVPGAILVNLGDLFEIWMGGQLRATEHQVLPPTDPTLRSRSRQSMVLFLTADDDVLVEPLTGDKQKYKAVNAWEHVMGRLEDSYI